jgi:alpha-ketoglutarate-dependent taurine dioxygenase
MQIGFAGSDRSTEIPSIACDFSIDRIDLKLVDSLFRREGIVLFDRTGANADQFTEFAGQFGAHTGLRDVFVGRKSLGWHSEYAYLPFRPGVVWFYCVNPAQRGGETNVVDGIYLYRRMDEETRRIISRLSLEFNMRQSQTEWELWIGTADVARASAVFNRCEGMTAIARTPDLLQIRYRTPALNECQFSKEFAFANTLLHALDDPEHYGMRTYNAAISASRLGTINELANKLSFSIRWEKEQFVMIDNSRFMHARNAYADASRNVKYLCTYSYDAGNSIDRNGCE